VTALGGEAAAGRKLLPGQESGFDACPSGGADFQGRYVDVGAEAMFWSSAETALDRANRWGTSAAGRLSVFAAHKGVGIGLRRLQNTNAR
jgi:hypothetical protein